MGGRDVSSKMDMPGCHCTGMCWTRSENQCCCSRTAMCLSILVLTGRPEADEDPDGDKLCEHFGHGDVEVGCIGGIGGSGA